MRLSDINPTVDGGMTQEEGVEQFLRLNAEFSELEKELYATKLNSVLIILQGLDTSGKDGAIRNVLLNVNPQGCYVESFKAPTEEELAHDFLWRAHRVTPRKGMIAVFNRSYYEDVLVVRVRELAPVNVIDDRYGHINDFERMLTASGTIVAKFFLYISKEEQERRLLAREARVDKAWKISMADWKERQLWDQYTSAYEEALSRCSTDCAPWYVVPADKKWFRNLAISETLVEILRQHRPSWQATLHHISEQRLKELEKLRSAIQIGDPD